MEIQQLRHLVAAVDCGNLVKAARECRISQSGLSRSIRGLEERLGVELLIRKSKGVEPTIYGQSVAQRARLVLNEVNRSIDEVRALQAAQIGDVTIGVTQNYGHYFIPQVLVDLYAARPEIHVNLVTGGFLDLLAQLKVGAIDLAFGLLGAIDDCSEIRIEPLREHHSRVTARATHPLAAQGREVTPQELTVSRWATLCSEGFQQGFARYFALRNLEPPIQVLRTDSIALIKHMVAGTDLLAVLPPAFVVDDVEAGTLAILNCEAPGEETQVGFMFREHQIVTPQSLQIVERIKQRLAFNGRLGARAAGAAPGAESSRNGQTRGVCGAAVVF